MDPRAIAVIIATLTSVLVAFITSYLAVKNIRREKVEDFKLEHIRNMIKAYQKLWSLMKPLSRIYYENYSIIVKEGDKYFLIRKHLLDFFQKFSDFFFSEHGLYLSKTLRNEIFSLRDKLFEIAEKNQNPRIELSNNKAKKLLKNFNWIYILIRNDIGVRDIIIPKQELGLKDDI